MKISILFVLLLFMWSCGESPESQQQTESKGLNQLLDSIKMQDEVQVLELIESGIDLNAYNSDGNTPLIMASAIGNPQIVKILLENGADATLSPPEMDPPLIVAARQGSIAVIKLLIESGASVNTTTQEGVTALECAHVAGKFAARDFLKSLSKTQ